MYNIFVVYYGELAIKGKNRSQFEQQLNRNIGQALKGEKIGKIYKIYGRSIVEVKRTSDIESITQKLSRVFGISWFAPAVLTSRSKRSYTAAAQKLFDSAVQTSKKRKPTFRINARRSYKNFPLTSMELNIELANKINAKLMLPVDLTKPDFSLAVSITEKGAILSTERHAGAGGMPVGTSGKVMMMLSGGIDSPVAAYQLMKRGCRVDFVHFYGEWPDKIKELARVLNQYQQYKSKLQLIPFKPLQMDIIKKVPQKQRLLIYRRFMFRIAEQLAQKARCNALATGESIAQVASQTIENMGAVESVVSLPVLRPIVTFDKQEIIDLAIKIGTYDLSIQPYEDCCSFFVPEHPELRATPDMLDKVESDLNIKKILKQMERNRSRDCRE